MAGLERAERSAARARVSPVDENPVVLVLTDPLQGARLPLRPDTTRTPTFGDK